NLCVIATSKWVLMDIQTCRLANIDIELQERYEPEEMSVFDVWDIDKSTQGSNVLNEVEYTVARNDVDFNSHMHNIYYINLAYNALPDKIYNLRPFNNFKITYKREIKLGEIVKCKYSQDKDKHIVSIYSQDESKLHSIMTLYNN
ncbi:MAG: hypothetical protein IJ272_04315, partial [Clostridia bacterium]|nr:hypothetical protein [Clostridia bacterium]